MALTFYLKHLQRTLPWRSASDGLIDRDFGWCAFLPNRHEDFRHALLRMPGHEFRRLRTFSAVDICCTGPDRFHDISARLDLRHLGIREGRFRAALTGEIS